MLYMQQYIWVYAAYACMCTLQAATKRLGSRSRAVDRKRFRASPRSYQHQIVVRLS